jgi:hypothetical protein
LLGYQITYVTPVEVGENKRFNDSLYHNFNYSFSGIVTEYKEINGLRGEHFALVSMKLRQSDVEYYDVGDTSSAYFCLIRYGTAKVMIPILYELARKRMSSAILAGDSLVFDGQRDKFILYFGGDSTSWEPLSFSSNPKSRNRMTYHLY